LSNIDGDLTTLKVTRPNGVWDNTYAVMSFPGLAGHPTLPYGTYIFAVQLKGEEVASSSLKLGRPSAC
jgi:hypothetical protein